MNAVEYLVADSAAFIKQVKLHKIAKNVYTVSDVISEISDKDTRERLQVLPYELLVREPKEETIAKVTEFSKKVGDFPSLSTTDIKVIALTYDLHVQYCGLDLPSEPTISKTFSLTKKQPENPAEIAGFYLPKGRKQESSTKSSDSLPIEQFEQLAVTVSDGLKCLDVPESTATAAGNGEGSTVTDSETEGESTSEESDSESESGWLTPRNVSQALLQMNSAETVETVTVGCITTDFAMQNVLLHLRLKVISLDGLRIRRLRSYVLRCVACFYINNDMSKKFCPQCGNATLKKLTTTVDDDGTTRYHLSTRKALTTRGLRYSLPLPKGGKHGSNPVLVEDQPTSHNRLSRKALQKLNVFDDDYEARNSPFLMKDTNSRSAMLGIKGLGRPVSLNPNAWQRGKKRGGKRH